MKKISIISGIASLAMCLIWLVCALIYCAFNDFPRKMPHKWNIVLAIPFIGLIASCVTFLICIRSLIVSEIKQLLKEID